MRYMKLPLGTTTTDTLCGNCPALGSDSQGPMASGYPLCRRLNRVLGLRTVRDGAIRDMGCISAEESTVDS
jgi:hypothetical protein